MVKKFKTHELLILVLSLSVGFLSCDSTDFVYVNDNTFQKQLARLNDGIIEVVLELNPEQRTDKPEKYIAPRKIIKEKTFTKKNKTSDVLCQLISNIAKRNERYVGKGWYPTYTIYIKYLSLKGWRIHIDIIAMATSPR